MLVSPSFELVRRVEWESMNAKAGTPLAMTQLEVNEILLQKQISELIGGQLEAYLATENEEITHYRVLSTRARLPLLQQLKLLIEEDETYVLHEYKDTIPLPPNIPSELKLCIHLPIQDGKAISTIICSPSDDVSKVIQSCCEKLKSIDNSITRAQDYLLKCTGHQSFFINGKMLDFDYVRDCLSKHKPVELSIVSKTELMKNYPREKVVTQGIVDKVLSATPTGKAFTESTCIFIHSRSEDLDKVWRVRVNGVQGLSDQFSSLFPAKVLNKGEKWYVYVQVMFYYGRELLFPSLCTSAVEAVPNVRFDHHVFTCPVKSIPRGTLINFSLKKLVAVEAPAQASSMPSELVGWVNCPAYDCFDVLTHSVKGLKLWQDDNISPISASNVFSSPAITLFLQFEENKLPIVFPKYPSSLPSSPYSSDPQQFQKWRKELEAIKQMDPLSELSFDQQQLVWKHRDLLRDDPRALTKFLLSVKWTDYSQVLECYQWLDKWKEIKPTQVLFSHFSQKKYYTHTFF